MKKNEKTIDWPQTRRMTASHLHRLFLGGVRGNGTFSAISNYPWVGWKYLEVVGHK